MSARVSRTGTGLSASFIVSAVIHLAVFLLLAWKGHLFPLPIAVQETYYVDVVDLPVADPIPGSSAQQPAVDAAPPDPVPATTAPSPIAPKTVAKPTPSAASQEPVATESAFAERMARLERNTEARREEAVLEKLRSKMKSGSGSKVGVPETGGTEAGSRYMDYLRSRLEDALKVTNSYTTKNPEVAVRLTITAEGRLSQVKIERSSGDAAFELAVRRAIDLASEKFTAPPNHAPFENGFIFKPRGISRSNSR